MTSVVVGIFDDAGNLDRAIETLSDRGLKDTVFDQSIVSQGAFRKHLLNYHLPGEVVDGYATHFMHGGKFVVVQVDKGRAAEVMDIFKRFDATQVHRHE